MGLPHGLQEAAIQNLQRHFTLWASMSIPRWQKAIDSNNF